MKLNIDQSLGKAKKLLKNDKIKEAKIIYNIILEHFPKNIRALESLKAISLRNKVSEAKVNLDPPANDFNNLEFLFNKKKFKELINNAEVLLKLFPNSPLLYNMIGVVNLETKNYDESLNFLNKALKLKPNDDQIYKNIGLAHFYNKSINQALLNLKLAIKLNPKSSDLYFNIGNIFQDNKNFSNAISSFSKAIELKPNNFSAYINMGICLYELGELNQSIMAYNESIKINPHNSKPYNNLAIVQTVMGDYDLAIKNCSHAIKLQSGLYVEAFINRGNIFTYKGEFNLAINDYLEALKYSPQESNIYVNLGNLENFKGNFEAAITYYKKAIKINPLDTSAYYNLSNVKTNQFTQKQINEMLKLRSNSNLLIKDIVLLCFALFKAFEDIGDFNKAFNFLSDGNKYKKEEIKYNIHNDQLFFKNNKKKFSPIQLDSKKFYITNKKPIFIVGMPRSGTSLIEQILAKHSKIFGAGELESLRKSVDKSEFNPNLSISEKLEIIRKNYLKELEQLNTKNIYITDKMPTNFKFIGFILNSIPEAKIIHIKRNSEATCFSIFKQNFKSRSNGYAYNFDDLITYYKMYKDLMQFWHSKFPDKIYDLNYEKLTEQQEQETKNVLKFLELQWEKECLQFHQNSRIVFTASSSQVREKMYQGSSQEWLKYKDHLKDIFTKI